MVFGLGSLSSAWRRRSLATASLLLLVACNGEEECDFLDVDASVRVERDAATEVPVSVGAVPSDLLSIPRLRITAYGRSQGLSHWLVARDGSHGTQCQSEPKRGCSILRDIESRTSFSVWIKGALTGEYDLELAFFEYKGDTTLFEDPVCTKHVAVEVR